MRLVVFGALLLVLTGCDERERLSRLEKQNQDLQAELGKQRVTTDYDLQSKCSRDAKTWFNENWGTGDKNTMLLNYSNHYNKTMNKCFIIVEYHYSVGESSSLWTNDITLWDVYENVQYGTFVQNHSVTYKPEVKTEELLISCEVYGTKCKGIEDFNNLVRPYLNN